MPKTFRDVCIQRGLFEKISSRFMLSANSEGAIGLDVDELLEDRDCWIVEKGDGNGGALKAKILILNQTGINKYRNANESDLYTYKLSVIMVIRKLIDPEFGFCVIQRDGIICEEIDEVLVSGIFKCKPFEATEESKVREAVRVKYDVTQSDIKVLSQDDLESLRTSLQPKAMYASDFENLLVHQASIPRFLQEFGVKTFFSDILMRDLPDLELGANITEVKVPYQTTYNYLAEHSGKIEPQFRGKVYDLEIDDIEDWEQFTNFVIKELPRLPIRRLEIFLKKFHCPELFNLEFPSLEKFSSSASTHTQAQLLQLKQHAPKLQELNHFVPEMDLTLGSVTQTEVNFLIEGMKSSRKLMITPEKLLAVPRTFFMQNVDQVFLQGEITSQQICKLLDKFKGLGFKLYFDIEDCDLSALQKRLTSKELISLLRNNPNIKKFTIDNYEGYWEHGFSDDELGQIFSQLNEFYDRCCDLEYGDSGERDALFIKDLLQIAKRNPELLIKVSMSGIRLDREYDFVAFERLLQAMELVPELFVCDMSVLINYCQSSNKQGLQKTDELWIDDSFTADEIRILADNLPELRTITFSSFSQVMELNQIVFPNLKSLIIYNKTQVAAIRPLLDTMPSLDLVQLEIDEAEILKLAELLTAHPNIQWCKLSIGGVWRGGAPEQLHTLDTFMNQLPYVHVSHDLKELDFVAFQPDARIIKKVLRSAEDRIIGINIRLQDLDIIKPCLISAVNGIETVKIEGVELSIQQVIEVSQGLNAKFVADSLYCFQLCKPAEVVQDKVDQVMHPLDQPSSWSSCEVSEMEGGKVGFFIKNSKGKLERVLVRDFHQPKHSPSQTSGNVFTLDARTNPGDCRLDVQRKLFARDTGPDPEIEDYKQTVYTCISVNQKPCDPSEVAWLYNPPQPTFVDPPQPVEICMQSFLHEPPVQYTERLRTYVCREVVTNGGELTILANAQITRVFISATASFVVNYSEETGMYSIAQTFGKQLPYVLVEYELVVIESGPMPNQLQWVNELTSQFESGELDMSGYSNPTGRDYLSEILCNQHKGVCRHIAAALMWYLGNIRIQARVFVNQLHAQVEANIEGIWWQLDPAGYQANFAIHQVISQSWTPPWISQNQLVVTQAQVQATNTITAAQLINTPEALSEITEVVLFQHKPDYRSNKDSAYPPIGQETYDHYFTEQVSDEAMEPEDFLTKVFGQERLHQLIICEANQLDGFSYLLQTACHQRQTPCLYLNELKALKLYSKDIEEDGRVVKKYHGRAYDFIKAAKKSSLDSFLIVDLLSQEQDKLFVAYNEIISDPRQVSGIDLSDNLKIIVLVGSESPLLVDASFTSRFKRAMSKCLIAPDKLTVASPYMKLAEANEVNDPLVIEFDNEPFWQNKVLGRRRLTLGGLSYQSSKLLEALQNKSHSNIVLHNPPNDPELERFFITAAITRSIYANNKTLPWPQLNLYQDESINYCYMQTCQISYGEPHHATLVINATTFSSLFEHNAYHPTTDGKGVVVEAVGYIKARAKDEVLSLYVIEELTEYQWAQLLKRCAENQCALQIIVRHGVNLPEALIATYNVIDSNEQGCVAEQASDQSTTDTVIWSSSLDFTISEFQADPNVICINVSELTVGQLLLATTHCSFNSSTNRVEASRFEGALLAELAKDHHVVLYGSFADNLRHQLQRLLHKRRFQPGDRKGKVSLIANSELMLKSFSGLVTCVNLQPNLAAKQEVLPEHLHERIEFESFTRLLSQSRFPDNSWLGITEPLPPFPKLTSFDLANAAEKVKAFNHQRMQAVNGVLQAYPMAVIVGPTSVGKTTFMRQVWRNVGARRFLYDDIESWISAEEEGVKLLLLDEANTLQSDLSWLDGIFNQTPGVVIGNRHCTLSESHKVVLIINPDSDSDNRKQLQLLVERGGAVIFDPLIAECIYLEALCPHIPDQVGAPELFVEPILEVYRYLVNLSRYEIIVTPRELQMALQLAVDFYQRNSLEAVTEVVKYFTYIHCRPFVPEQHLEDYDKQFYLEKPSVLPCAQLPSASELVLTESSSKLADMLLYRLLLRESHLREGGHKPAAQGALLWEGPPGVGKSQFAVEVLKANGFIPRAIDDLTSPLNPKEYLHLPASLDSHLKIELLVWACRHGYVIVIDEFDGAFSTYLPESELNDLLMGVIPARFNQETRKCEQAAPGFLALLNQNGYQRLGPGRRRFGPALQRRMHTQSLDYNKDEMFAIISQKYNLAPYKINVLIAAYLQACQQDPGQWCFRDLLTAAADEASIGKNLAIAHLSHNQLIAIIEDEHTDPEVLADIYFLQACPIELKHKILCCPRVSNAFLLSALQVSESLEVELVAQLVENPNLHPDILSELAKHCDLNVSRLVAGHPNCDLDLCYELAIKSDDPELLIIAACNKELSPSALIRLLQKSHDLGLIHVLLCHPRCCDTLLRQITQVALKINSLELYLAITFHSDFTPDMAAKILASQPDPMVLDAILHRYGQDDQMLSCITQWRWQNLKNTLETRVASRFRLGLFKQALCKGEPAQDQPTEGCKL